MYIFQHMRCKKVCLEFLLLLLMALAMMIMVLQTYATKCSVISNTTSSSNIRQKQYKNCHAFDPLITPRHLFQAFFSIFHDSSWLTKPASFSPSFQELHNLLFGPTAPNLYEAWPNYFNKTFDPSYPHTSLIDPVFEKILKGIDIPITFVVEVGSFMGKSATNIVRTLQKRKSTQNFVLLCIDTSLGGPEHWLQDELRQMMGIAYGRPIVYEQFIANIIANNLTSYVIPYSAPSILGARFLLEKKLFPQIIYLDSAHAQGETYIELELYWSLLQPGGILMGDDWGLPSIDCDILRFTDSIKVNVKVMRNTWFIKKRKSF